MKSTVCDLEYSLSVVRYISALCNIIEYGICHSTGRVCYRCLHVVDSLIEVSIRIELIKSMFQFCFAWTTECSVSFVHDTVIEWGLPQQPSPESTCSCQFEALVRFAHPLVSCLVWGYAGRGSPHPSYIQSLPELSANWPHAASTSISTSSTSWLAQP